MDFGKTAPNPVISTLKYFRNEYIDHIVNKKCTAGECKALANVVIDPNKCMQCGLCKSVCPVDAIDGVIKHGAFKIDHNKCIKCLACVNKCPFKAISK